MKPRSSASNPQTSAVLLSNEYREYSRDESDAFSTISSSSASSPSKPEPAKDRTTSSEGCSIAVASLEKSEKTTVAVVLSEGYRSPAAEAKRFAGAGRQSGADREFLRSRAGDRLAVQCAKTVQKNDAVCVSIENAGRGPRCRRPDGRAPGICRQTTFRRRGAMTGAQAAAAGKTRTTFGGDAEREADCSASGVVLAVERDSPHPPKADAKNGLRGGKGDRGKKPRREQPGAIFRRSSRRTPVAASKAFASATLKDKRQRKDKAIQRKRGNIVRK